MKGDVSEQFLTDKTLCHSDKLLIAENILGKSNSALPAVLLLLFAFAIIRARRLGISETAGLICWHRVCQFLRLNGGSN